jgi:flagellar biosynthetic protein FliQ
MSPENVVDLMSETVYLIVLMVSALVVPSLLVGLLVSVFQAATQINEQTLSFLPRLVVTLAALVVFGHWMINTLMAFFDRIVKSIPYMLG